jgi:hypothetical protein
MYDRRFFSTRLGKAAAIAMAAMVAFNIFALTHQLGAAPTPFVASVHMVELA